MKICTSCKSESPDNTRFCGQCGLKFITHEESSTGNSITHSSGLYSNGNPGTPADGNITSISANNEEKTEISSHHTLPTTPIPEARESEEEEEGLVVPFPFMPNNAPTPPPGNVLSQGPLNIDQVPSGGQPHILGQAHS